MCGIIAGFSTAQGKEKAEKVNQYIIDQYENQYLRGQRGFGIIRIEKGKIEVDRACEPAKFLIDLYMKPSSMIIAHHRTPTSTENWLDQTHPMFISNDLLQHDYYIIHNGVISNDMQLHNKHIELGFVYTTEYEEEPYSQYSVMPKKIKFNDSEALAIEVAMFIEGLVKLVEIDNSAAFIALQVNKKKGKGEKVFYGRNNLADLNMQQTKGNIIISSEGAGTEVPANILYSFYLKDKAMKISEQPMPFKKTVVPTYTRPATYIPAATNLNLPIKQDISKNKITETTETNEVRTTRSWIDLDKEIDFEDFPTIDKNYIDVAKAAFKERIKNDTARDISATIDDALDEEMQRITEIIESYKNILLTDQLEPQESSYFLEKISKIMKTMRILTNMAEEDYNEKALMEDQADIDDYNSSFLRDYETGYEDKNIERETWPGYSKQRTLTPDF